MPYSPDDLLFAARLKALAHPARLAIMRALINCERTTCCGDIVSSLPLAQSTVSEHLRVLSAAGLITCQPVGTRCCYQPVPEAIALLEGGLASLRIQPLALAESGPA